MAIVLPRGEVLHPLKVTLPSISNGSTDV